MRTNELPVFCLLAGAIALGASAPVAISPAARALHFDALVLDAHDDTTQRLLDPAFDFGARHAAGANDLPRMREGGLDALFFSIWIPGRITGATAVRLALAQIEAVRRQATLHPRDLALATTAAEVRAAAPQHRVAALIGIEGGHMIADDLANLDRFFALGARYLTLTHSANTTWADSSGDKPAHHGLTEFGKRVIAEMNRLGMIVDVSHVSDETFYDVLATSQAPVFASHSACRAICNAPRNMSDAMIRDLAAKGGVIQINFFAGFLSQAYWDALEADGGRLDQELDVKAKQKCGEDVACSEIERLRLEAAHVAAGKLPRVDWTAIVDHIDHAVKLVGAEHVGLGSDFDGASMPAGMEGASHLPQITDALLKRGYSSRDIRNILGENTLRVMSEVEATASRLQRHAKP